MKFFLSLLLSCCLLCAGAASIYASCERVTPEKSYRQSNLVFIGIAEDTSFEEIGQLNPKSRTSFKVDSVLKGKKDGTIEIVTPAGSVLEKGETYIVYAYATTKNNYLYSYEAGEYATQTDDGECGGTKLLSQAQNDLDRISALQEHKRSVQMIVIGLSVILLLIATIVGGHLSKKRMRRRL